MDHKLNTRTNTTSPVPTPIQSIFEKTMEIWDSDQTLETAQDLEDFEQTVHNLGSLLKALLVEQKLQTTLNSEQMINDSVQLAKKLPCKTKNNGYRDVSITTESGICILISTLYFTTKKGGKGRKKKCNKGLYPALLLLGINNRCTPMLISELGETVATVGSFEEAKDTLSRRGVEFDVKTIRDIAYRMAQRARAIQQAGTFDYGENLNGRRVVISTDGGRVRTRRKKRGKKTTKGRNRYHTDWREPKILIIYITDEHGRRDKTFSPFIDGIIQGPDALFSLLHHYLDKLGIKTADKILFVTDGAKWIWERTQSLMKSLGLKSEQFYELLDFYHAVEHIAKVASLRKKLNKKTRKLWIKKQRKLLISGKIDQVIDTIKSFCRGRNSGKIQTQLRYFIKNSPRMKYNIMAELGLPLGSGAIESAVRRVVNLRIKGPGIFWKKENADAILLLRSYFKAGRWNLLKQMAISVDYSSMTLPTF